jgi:hypothetical protein
LGMIFLSLLYGMVCGGLFFREVVIICAEPTALLIMVFSWCGRTEVHPYNMGQAYGFLQRSHSLMTTPLLYL